MVSKIINITKKSDLGFYNYDSIRPHTITSITTGENGTGTEVKTFSEYDANGNMTMNNGRRITYASFNKPIEIKHGIKNVKFSYDANNNRYLKYTPTETIHYIDKSYEKIFGGGSIQHRYFVYADGKLVSIYTNNDNSYKVDFLHYDNLGSIDTITDYNGVVTQRFIYKPFGERIVLDSNGGLSSNANTKRGYTGHEHIDEFDFIHMNGRVYDPIIGRFVSADPNIFEPFDSQGFNRYSYTRNNPMRYVDPSGYAWEEDDDGATYEDWDNVFDKNNNWMEKKDHKDGSGVGAKSFDGGTVTYNENISTHDVSYDNGFAHGFDADSNISYTHDDRGQYTSENIETGELNAGWDSGSYSRGIYGVGLFHDKQINYYSITYKGFTISNVNFANGLKNASFVIDAFVVVLSQIPTPQAKAAVISLSGLSLGAKSAAQLLDPSMKLENNLIGAMIDNVASHMPGGYAKDVAFEIGKEVVNNNMGF